jgi:hypothetical protein
LGAFDVMSDPRREHFTCLRRISSGKDVTISHATAVASSRVYHRAWAATDRLLPVPAIEVDPDGTLFCKWTRDRFQLEVYFVPDESPFWTSGVEGDIWGTNIGERWDASSSLPNELREDFDRIVGREPARPAPYTPPPPRPPGLLQSTLFTIYLALILASLGGLEFAQVVPGSYWIAAICGAILMVCFVGPMLLVMLLVILGEIAGRWAQRKR